MTNWYGLLVPAATPRAVIPGLQQETARILNLPALKERLAQDGMTVVASPPEQFAEFLTRDGEVRQGDRSLRHSRYIVTGGLNGRVGIAHHARVCGAQCAPYGLLPVFTHHSSPITRDVRSVYEQT
jgi:hypothetical protein